jgi:hypothetical protein
VHKHEPSGKEYITGTREGNTENSKKYETTEMIKATASTVGATLPKGR